MILKTAYPYPHVNDSNIQSCSPFSMNLQYVPWLMIHWSSWESERESNQRPGSVEGSNKKWSFERFYGLIGWIAELGCGMFLLSKLTLVSLPLTSLQTKRLTALCKPDLINVSTSVRSRPYYHTHVYVNPALAGYPCLCESSSSRVPLSMWIRL